eukprot:TRINITY_DN16632_c0_g1_i1.p1 TRINITY_DN16632_c0_g1~~TRINITY_DN16632_c0_g1_i1.p1  ORF type:complete len:886 (+),score=212.36 TRINITY_DN16632_c0_g1_i1:162-2660(+)
MTELVVLNISRNQFTALPDLSGLRNLQELRASGNKISNVPLWFNSLVSLQILDLSFNSLAIFSITLCTLVTLISLDLSNNLFHSVPETLVRLTNLVHLNISGNPLVGMPGQGVENGLSDVLIYCNRLLHKKQEPQYRAKVMVLGEPNKANSVLLQDFVARWKLEVNDNTEKTRFSPPTSPQVGRKMNRHVTKQNRSQMSEFSLREIRYNVARFTFPLQIATEKDSHLILSPRQNSSKKSFKIKKKRGQDEGDEGTSWSQGKVDNEVVVTVFNFLNMPVEIHETLTQVLLSSNTVYLLMFNLSEDSSTYLPKLATHLRLLNELAPNPHIYLVGTNSKGKTNLEQVTSMLEELVTDSLKKNNECKAHFVDINLPDSILRLRYMLEKSLQGTIPMGTVLTKQTEMLEIYLKEFDCSWYRSRPPFLNEDELIEIGMTCGLSKSQLIRALNYLTGVGDIIFHSLPLGVLLGHVNDPLQHAQLTFFVVLDHNWFIDCLNNVINQGIIPSHEQIIWPKYSLTVHQLFSNLFSNYCSEKTREINTPDLEIYFSKLQLIGINKTLNHSQGFFYFREYLKTEFSEENLDFYQKVKEFEELPESLMKEASLLIFNNFIGKNAPKLINIMWTVKAPLEKLVNEGKYKREMFHPAQVAVYKLFKQNHWTTFLKSEFALQFVNHLLQYDGQWFDQAEENLADEGKEDEKKEKETEKGNEKERDMTTGCTVDREFTVVTDGDDDRILDEETYQVTGLKDVAEFNEKSTKTEKDGETSDDEKKDLNISDDLEIPRKVSKYLSKTALKTSNEPTLAKNLSSENFPGYGSKKSVKKKPKRLSEAIQVEKK